jgi:hypothetical protein
VDEVKGYNKVNLDIDLIVKNPYHGSNFMIWGDTMSNQYRPWSEDEKELLRKLVAESETGSTSRLKSCEIKKIAACFPERSKQALYIEIHRQRNSGEIQRREYRPWSSEEEVMLRTLYAGEKWRLNLKENFPDREPRDVLEKARRLGLSRRILKTKAKKLTPMQKGILAGLIMGDGCLSHRLAGHGRKQHINSIEFTNADPGLVEQFASMVTNCTVRSYQRSSGFKKERRPHYSASVNSREAVKNILNQILPCLAGEKLLKAREMLICLEGGHGI